MRLRYEAAPSSAAPGGVDWYVRDVHPDGRTAIIKCYCYGEIVAREIAKALNLLDAVGNTLEGSGL